MPPAATTPPSTTPRTLLVNADDFGIYPQANPAVVDAFDNGLVASCSVMTPSPGAPDALRILADRPDVAFGIHLTLVADFPDQRWNPLTDGRSLLDAGGQLFTPDDKQQLLAQATIDDVEAEFRAQIELVLAAGLRPTHVDWHCLADGGRPALFDLTVELADEYGLAVRAWLPDSRRKLAGRGRPTVDHDFLDSFAVPLDDKPQHLARRLRELEPGLTEWAVHPAFDHPDDGGTGVRQSDYDFLVSAEAREIVEEEGITVIGWGDLLQAWD
ncbi:hypothetical protein FB561_2391 [Kribbella amoyensis]|uniref:Glycoside hydrolase/deacetylase ChbG (UPF0249 family) n=1 Tax=Kribbella amoyensis TaxID=996641 RepID=A0A561BQX6_9ACTN|nr:ChbG/HpnK family deacetylase [Kribbella amoyensis]TWD81280.1 hypothetical protein FB561_2391 [Kribbella amoyensis]